MKNRIIMLLLVMMIISGCTTTSWITQEKETQEKNISRDQAEFQALKFLYDHTKNKEVYDKEIKVSNYVFDSWKEDDIWHIIIYVGHTFIEVLVYDDRSENIKVLSKTDYWRTAPKDVKTKVYDNMNKETGVDFS